MPLSDHVLLINKPWLGLNLQKLHSTVNPPPQTLFML